MKKGLSHSFCKSKVRHEMANRHTSLWMFVWLNQNLNSALPWAKLTVYFPLTVFPTSFISKCTIYLQHMHMPLSLAVINML